jgi:hypothetical protein
MNKNSQNIIQRIEVSAMCKTLFYVDCRQYEKISPFELIS